MQNQLLASKYNLTTLGVYVFGAIGILAFLILILTQICFKENITIWDLLFVAVFLAIGFLLLNLIDKTPRIIIYNDRIEVINLLSKKTEVIDLNLIVGWVNKQDTSKGKVYHKLYLSVNNHSILKINSQNYDNYQELEQALIIGKGFDNNLAELLQLKENRKNGFTSLIFAFFLFSIAFKSLLFQKLGSNDIEVVNGRLKESIKLIESRGSKSIKLNLVEYPKHTFVISSNVINSSNYKSLIDNFKKGSEIFFSISRFESNKIKNNVGNSFWSLSNSQIEIVEIVNNHIEYLALKDYNRINESNSKWGLFIGSAVGLFFLISSIALFKQQSIQ